jgi:hypothetical protein
MMIGRIVAMILFTSVLSGCAWGPVHEKCSVSPSPVRVNSEYKADEMLIKWIRVDPIEFDELGAQVRSTFGLKSGGIGGMAIMNPDVGGAL